MANRLKRRQVKRIKEQDGRSKTCQYFMADIFCGIRTNCRHLGVLQNQKTQKGNSVHCLAFIGICVGIHHPHYIYGD